MKSGSWFTQALNSPALRAGQSKLSSQPRLPSESSKNKTRKAKAKRDENEPLIKRVAYKPSLESSELFLRRAIKAERVGLIIAAREELFRPRIQEDAKQSAEKQGNDEGVVSWSSTREKSPYPAHDDAKQSLERQGNDGVVSWSPMMDTTKEAELVGNKPTIIEEAESVGSKPILTKIDPHMPLNITRVATHSVITPYYTAPPKTEKYRDSLEFVKEDTKNDKNGFKIRKHITEKPKFSKSYSDVTKTRDFNTKKDLNLLLRATLDYKPPTSPGWFHFKPTKRQQFRQTQSFSKRSILDELFPESSTTSPASDIAPLPLTRESLGLDQEVSWKPLADAPATEPTPFLHPSHPSTEPSDPLTARLRDSATVLVVSGVSRTLSLSDFQRLSPRGEHIENWSSGLLRVIPGRNSSTLERLNHYFLLFSSRAAANAYRDNLMVLHRLSAKLTPQMPTDKALLASKDGKVEGWLDERDMVNGVDVMEAVRGFTLIPNVQKKFGARILEKPYRPAVARIIEKGAYHNLLMQGKDKQGENLVLFYVDQGTINLSMVEKLLGEDGRRRNLNWALEGHQDGDIIPFGVGKDGKSRSSSANEEYEREYMDDEEGEKRTRRSNPGVPPRYIIRFTDAIEARRFVRSWHTRVLDGEPWDTIGASGKWAGGMVNAEILW